MSNVTPAGRLTPATGHQVLSVLLPPILRTGACPGARLRTSRSNTGSSELGSEPA